MAKKKKKKSVENREQKKFKYYAIKECCDGRKGIIVSNWKRCYDLTNRHTLEYKTFNSEQEAREYLGIDEEGNQVIKPQKTINVFIAGSCDSMHTKKGYYIGIMEYKGVKKTLHKEIENTTSHKVLIQGVIDILNSLKEPCIVELYVGTQLGFRRMKTKNGTYKENPSGVNRDILKILKDTILSGNHEVNEHLTSEYIDYLKNIYKNKKIT